ncbi:hypothetical protein BVX93_00775, partial [bacterium B13(2017)]
MFIDKSANFLSTSSYSYSLAFSPRIDFIFSSKDQTYFLYPIKKQVLSNILFPLSDLRKEEVRNLAKQFNLPVSEKKESQDICFIPDKDIRNFLMTHIKEIKPGPIINKKEKIL